MEFLIVRSVNVLEADEHFLELVPQSSTSDMVVAGSRRPAMKAERLVPGWFTVSRSDLAWRSNMLAVAAVAHLAYGAHSSLQGNGGAGKPGITASLALLLVVGGWRGTSCLPTAPLSPGRMFSINILVSILYLIHVQGG